MHGQQNIKMYRVISLDGCTTYTDFYSAAREPAHGYSFGPLPRMVGRPWTKAHESLFNVAAWLVL